MKSPVKVPAIMRFTTDWVSRNDTVWKKILSKYINLPGVKAIEIGVFEGRSSIWFLTNILTHKTSKLICIDPYEQPVFHENVQRFIFQIQFIKEAAQTTLRDRKFDNDSFDFIYIDGDHRARSVLEMAVLCFSLLKKGGILIFDDYLWLPEGNNDPLLSPRIAIDAFLHIYQGHYNLLHKEWQVIIERKN